MKLWRWLLERLLALGVHHVESLRAGTMCDAGNRVTAQIDCDLAKTDLDP